MRKLYCWTCKKNCDHTTRAIEETYSVKGEPITIVANVSFCSECGEPIWDSIHDNENLAKAFNAFRERHRFLLPKQIKAIRDKYNLSQYSFGLILGLDAKTISRYEEGSLQEVAHNNLIALADNPYNFEFLLEKNPEIPEYERVRLNQIIAQLKSKD